MTSHWGGGAVAYQGGEGGGCRGEAWAQALEVAPAQLV